MLQCLKSLDPYLTILIMYIFIFVDLCCLMPFLSSDSLYQHTLDLELCCEFQLKELEKLGPKKGVITQSVKDVVQSLVDDDLVLKDKIGTSVSKFFQIVLAIKSVFTTLKLRRA